MKKALLLIFASITVISYSNGNCPEGDTGYCVPKYGPDGNIYAWECHDPEGQEANCAKKKKVGDLGNP